MSGQRWDAMSVTEYTSQGATKSKWTKIGAAFTNQDGSIGIQLDCLPLDGRIVLQVPLTYEQKQAKYANRQGGGGGGGWGGQQGQPQQQRGGYGGRGGGGGRGGYGGGGQQQSFQQPNQPAPYAPDPQGDTDFDYGHNEGGGGDDVPFR